MPFSVKYDVQLGGIAFSGLVVPNEVNDFERQYLDAVAALRAATITEAQPAPRKAKRGNWYSLFEALIAHAQHFAPDNNEYNMPDPYGFKEIAVRMWRAISQASFVDGKHYVESLIKGADRPTGTEHGDIPDEAIAETVRLFDEAKAKLS